jgi:tRNA (cytosine38-C5)-methyltransferase
MKDDSAATYIQQQQQVSMFEFFSGIGGMRIAVESAMKIVLRNDDEMDESCCLSSCRAYDISLHAKRCYQHNFSHSDATQTNSNVSTKLVEHLKPNDVDACGKSHLWTLSPPCQPFTTNGKNKQCLDSDDKRCNGLKSLIKLLHRIKEKPTWILLENVQGFANSDMVQEYYTCLTDNGYTYKRYLLSPIQLGIPNHRLRFYVLAERSNRWANEIDVHTEVPPSVIDALPAQHTVGDYLKEMLEDNNNTPYLVPDSVLEKNFAQQLGIVTALDTATHCFTAAYGRIYHRSTGSLLLMRPTTTTTTKDNEPFAAVSKAPLDRTNMLNYSGRLRRFTPSELLLLFGFPRNFAFPEDIPLEHQYKLIGNSISIAVVTALMVELLRLEVKNCNGDQNGSKRSCRVVISNTTKKVGGSKGHMEEEIDGPLLALYQRYRWKMIPNCTGRYTCRDHQLVSRLSPLNLLEQAGIDPPSMSASWNEYTFDHLQGRPDQVLVIPMNMENTVGLISFVKRQDDNSRLNHVHTLNTPSGFRRKLEGIGLEVTKGGCIQIILKSKEP